MLKAAHHGRRHQHERLAERLGLQIGDERDLADVEFQFAHHHEERLVDRIDLGETKRDAVGGDAAALQRLGLRIIAETAVDGFEFFRRRRAHLDLPPELAIDFTVATRRQASPPRSPTEHDTHAAKRRKRRHKTQIDRIPAERIESFVASAFVAAGLPAADAQTLARLMVEADLRGSDTHGVIRLPLYVRRIRAGGINPKPNIRVVERPAVGGSDRRRQRHGPSGDETRRRACDREGQGHRHRLGRRAHEQSRRPGLALCHHAARPRHDRALFRRRQQQSSAALGRQRKPCSAPIRWRSRCRRATSRRSCSTWRRRSRLTARCGSRRSAANRCRSAG